MMLRFYADESGDDRSGIVRIAGYLMTDEQWKRIDSGVDDALGRLRWFHMKTADRMAHPRAYKRLLQTISPRSVLCGVSVSVNRKEYDALASERSGKETMKSWMGSHYSFLVQAAMHLCGIMCREQQRLDDWIAYFFESGHPSEGDANVSVNLFAKRQYRGQAEAARYASHTFLAKEGPLSKALIPCDILAWHLTRAQREGEPSEELRQLLQTPACYKNFTADDIRWSIARSKLRMDTFNRHGRPYKH